MSLPTGHWTLVKGTQAALTEFTFQAVEEKRGIRANSQEQRRVSGQSLWIDPATWALFCQTNSNLAEEGVIKYYAKGTM